LVAETHIGNPGSLLFQHLKNSGGAWTLVGRVVASRSLSTAKEKRGILVAFFRRASGSETMRQSLSIFSFGTNLLPVSQGHKDLSRVVGVGRIGRDWRRTQGVDSLAALALEGNGPPCCVTRIL